MGACGSKQAAQSDVDEYQGPDIDILARALPQQAIDMASSPAVVFPPDKTRLPAMQPTSKDQANRSLGLVAGGEKRMGPRPDQQDYFETCATVSEDVFGGDLQLCAFGVFDGHGGDGVAKYLAKHMCSKLVTATREAALSDPRSLQQVIEQVYLEVDSVVCGLPFARNAGSCAVTAQLMGDALVVANAGDCEAWLCRNGEPVELTVPHKAENPAEQKRIAAAGGVIYERNHRLASVLAITRNFGAFNVKSMSDARGLTALPHVTVMPLQPEDEFMILGSDGLFDRFPNRQNLMNFAKAQLRKTRSAAATAKAITDHVLDERNGTDNTTVQVVVFNQMGVVSAQAGAYGVAEGFAKSTGKCAWAVRTRSRSIARDMMDAAAAVAGSAAGPATASALPAAPTLTAVLDRETEEEDSESDVEVQGSGVVGAQAGAAQRQREEEGTASPHSSTPDSSGAGWQAAQQSQAEQGQRIDDDAVSEEVPAHASAAGSAGGGGEGGGSKLGTEKAGGLSQTQESTREAHTERTSDAQDMVDGPSHDSAGHCADLAGEPAVDVPAA